MADRTSTVNEIQRESEKKLTRRMNYLRKKYEGVNQKDIPRDVKNEIISIQKIFDAFTGADDKTDQDKTKISNSEQENWYYNMMRFWINNNPNSVSSFRYDTRATVYRFALHFFVEEVILNPKNNALNYAALREHMSTLTETRNRELNRINQKLNGVEKLLSYVAALETADAETNPKFGNDFDSFTSNLLETELNENSPFAKGLDNYLEKRQQDLMNRRKLTAAEKMGREE